MHLLKIPYQQTGYFSKTVLDYVSNDEKISPFYNLYPNLKNFDKQIKHKGQFSKKKREILVKVLKQQYKNSAISKKTERNINLLQDSETFTITTGHQLNLFTGPLYFLYKIISVINLTEQLKEKYPSKNFVPIYWMATEDHDFDEINYFNFKKHQLQWQKHAKGAVGRLDTKGLKSVYTEFKKQLGKGKHAKYLAVLFKKAYLEHTNLADATRFLANTLFKTYGLVVIDADNTSLKREFIPYIKEELRNQTGFKTISKTKEKLAKNYKIQVNPREINLFYLKDNLRERIILENGKYLVLNTDIVFTKEEILKEIENYPERFSPNVIMRPLYQEVILPNLAYVGGGGELAYWLELKAYFEQNKVVFPILMLRNSVLLITEKEYKKTQKLKLTIPDLFLKQHQLVTKKVKEISNLNLDFSKQKDFLKQQFLQLKDIAKQTDVSFVGAVNAQEKKQLKGLDNLEKRLIKAEKRKLKEVVTRIEYIQNKLFPNKSLQERQVNFSEYYLMYGEELLHFFKNNLNPLEANFTIIVK